MPLIRWSFSRVWFSKIGARGTVHSILGSSTTNLFRGLPYVPQLRLIGLMNPAPRETNSKPRLVIFGCGYLGSEVARQGIERGMAVVALTRNPATAVELESLGITAVVADLATDAWHERITGPIDYAVNCVSSGGGGIASYRRSYVEGMDSIVAWARKTPGIGTLAYTSSTSVYSQDDGVEVDENAATDGGTDRSKLLLAAESILRGNSDGIRRWFILRLAGLYGPGRHSLVEQVRAGEVAGTGRHHLNLIHRDDACAAIWSALVAPPDIANEIFNVADDGAATKAEMVDWLAQQLEVPPPKISGQSAMDRQPTSRDRIILNGKLRARLGWAPNYRTFREGYARILSR